MGVVRLEVVQVQFGSVQLGVVQLGVVQMGVDPVECTSQEKLLFYKNFLTSTYSICWAGNIGQWTHESDVSFPLVAICSRGAVCSTIPQFAFPVFVKSEGNLVPNVLSPPRVVTLPSIRYDT